jgi:transcriptional regulator with XRE-family HTH domain
MPKVKYPKEKIVIVQRQFTKSIWGIIDTILKERGISDTMLAKGSGVGTAEISGYRSGKKLIRFTPLARVLDFLNITIDNFVKRRVSGIDSISAIDIELFNIIKQFQNKPLERDVNEALLTIERFSSERFKDISLDIIGVAKGIKMALEDDGAHKAS